MLVRVVAALASLALTAASGSHAQGASGTFTIPEGTLEVVDAYAFRAPSAFDDELEVIQVAVSNVPFNPAIDRYLDRRYILDNFVQGEGTAIVYFEILPDGRYNGLSYQAGPGMGCGFCRDIDVEADLEVGDDRVVGTLRRQGEDRSWDLTLDARLVSSDHGEPLPDDGGAPGAAYRAFSQALRAGDEAALRRTFSQGLVEAWDAAREAGEGDVFLRAWVEDHPADWKLVRGWQKEDVALLVVHGTRGGEAVEAEVVLLAPAGEWRINDEVVRPREE